MNQTEISQVVEKNLSLMQKPREEKYSFQRLMVFERIGGNNNYWKGFPCIRSNFYFNQENGEIVAFGKSHRVEDKIKDNYKEGTLKIAINLSEQNLDNRRYTKIVHCEIDELPTCIDVINRTIEQYNETYGFKAAWKWQVMIGEQSQEIII